MPRRSPKPEPGRSLADRRPALALQWDGKKTGALTPAALTRGSGLKVWWRCPKSKTHGWKAESNSRSRGGGCPFCGRRAVCPDNCLARVFPRVARSWHPSKNGSLRPTSVTPWSSRRVWWIYETDRAHQWQVAVRDR